MNVGTFFLMVPRFQRVCIYDTWDRRELYRDDGGEMPRRWNDLWVEEVQASEDGTLMVGVETEE